MKSAALRTTAWVILIAMVLAEASPGARGASFNAITDLWIRENEPLRISDNDLISVWSPATGDQRRGVVMWDISGFPDSITSAVVQLFDRQDVRSQTTPLIQQAFLIDPPEIVDYTWEEYASLDEPSQITMQSLGAYNIVPPDSIGGYQDSDVASAADVAHLESRRTGSGLITLVFAATDGPDTTLTARDWGDIEFDGTPPRLWLNEDPPPFGDLDGNGEVNEADFDVIEANWLQSVIVGEGGDMTFDGVVNLDDFVVFKGVLSQQGEGSSGMNGVPEPSTLVLLLAASVALLLHRAWLPLAKTN
jgi:hypothetical protein